jgi:hypothetical protein
MPKKVTDETIIAALRKNAGIISHAAADCGIGRSSLSERVKNNPVLKAVSQEVDESVLDAAEGIVKVALLKKKDEQTARWYLSRKGKARGYGTSIDHNHRLDDSLIDAIVASFGGDVEKLRAFRRSLGLQA